MDAAQTEGGSVNELPKVVLDMENEWFVNGNKLNPDGLLNILKSLKEKKSSARGGKSFKIPDSYKSYQSLTTSQKEKVAAFWMILKEEDQVNFSNKTIPSLLQTVYNAEKAEDTRNLMVIILPLYTKLLH